MSLINCKECAKQISSQAKSCPNCGASIKRKSSCGLLLLILIAIIVLGILFAPRLSNGSKYELSEAEQEEIDREAKVRAQRSFESELKVKGKRAVKSQLKDPDSATFKDVRYGYSEAAGEVVYGYVNSKNSFGGFTGNKRFISNGKTTLIEGRDPRLMEVWGGIQQQKKN